jgi:two-component system chemotaxis sensor kinase CheA
VKVDTYKLDNLVDMIGELVIVQSLIKQNSYIISIDDQKLTRDFSQLSRITSDLQKAAMSMRMVPIRQTFQKMIRLVRDLCRKSGKEVELIMSGEETEIDRNMVEAIYDPLVHMIRNTVDHGIEPKEKRIEKGKPARGSVQLKAYHKGGNIVIEIEDDGQGLDRNRILKKALEKGLVKENDELSDHEIVNLIFESGFSTRDSVTDVSGRGVGMDVVKKTIEDLRGKIEIHSTPDRGCLFILKLPLTLAIIDGIIIKVADQRYILPTIAVQESLRPERTHYTTVAGKGEMIRIRDNLLPLVRLHEIFHLPSEEKDPWEALVVVAESEGKRKCLLVDELMDKQEVVIKSLGESFRKLKGISGGAIMGDGSVGLILDIPGIFDLSEHRPN